MTIGFLKELLRRAAMYAAEDATGQGPRHHGRPRRCPGRAADSQGHTHERRPRRVLDSRNQLTRILLGGHPAHRPPASPNPAAP